MKIAVFGTNSKTAPIEIREKLSLSGSDVISFLQLLRQYEAVHECLILSTCNRIELYALVAESSESLLVSVFKQWFKVDIDYEKYMYYMENEEALVHISEVAAGLDSMVLGESEIFGQMKEAYALAQGSDCVGFIFKSLFTQIFSIVKKVRSFTGVGASRVSVSYVAVDLAKTVVGNIGDKNALLIGAGEMGIQTMRNLVKEGVRHVYISNRTFEKAVKIAEDYGGIPIMIHEIVEYLPKADIIISSIDVRDYIINVQDIAPSAQKHFDGKQLIIDISVPRSVNPVVNEQENVCLYNIDDLKSIAEKNSNIRKEEAEKARSYIASKVNDILRKLDSQDLSRTIARLKDFVDVVRSEGLEKISANNNMSDVEKADIESSIEDMINKIVHHTISKLKEFYNAIHYE